MDPSLWNGSADLPHHAQLSLGRTTGRHVQYRRFPLAGAAQHTMRENADCSTETVSINYSVRSPKVLFVSYRFCEFRAQFDTGTGPD